jgi:adenylate cyclase
MSDIKRAVQFSVTGCIVFFAVCAAQFAGFFTWTDCKSYDSRMMHTAPYVLPSEKIAVVLLDQDSLDWAKTEKSWGWPWPRSSYGVLVDYFNRAGAASVAFDMLFTEPSVYGSADDKLFADACSRYGHVVQTVYYDADSPDTPLKPVPQIASSAAMLGNITSSIDSDGVVRRARFYAPSKSAEPCLALASLMTAGENIDIKKIPEANGGGMYVRYVEDITRYAPYSMKQILTSEYEIEKVESTGTHVDFAHSDYLDPKQFAGMHVFFGLYTPGLFDICTSPVSSVYPGVGVHISQLDTIMRGDYLYDTPLWCTIILAFITSVLGILLGASRRQIRLQTFLVETGIFAVGIAAYIFFLYAAFFRGLILPFSAPLAAFVLSFICAVSVSYLTEGKQRRYLKAAFRQYLSPAVIDELIEKPSLLKLGGEEREITAFFSDVQGFTSISEKLHPDELTDLLNTYLSAMTDVILAHGGTIDKYEGDAIIAFWNAPTFQEDHARRAVEAAIECQKKLTEMRPVLRERSGKDFYQRIGLNTGRAVVGNMGSRSRFDYTMLGDSVNLASRLEGINKQFGTYTMCSRATMQSAVEHGCQIEFRQLANIAVVGRKEPVVVFEPMTSEEYVRRQPEFSVFKQGMEMFVKGDFDGCSRLLATIAKIDPAAVKYIEKCVAYSANPPENWDGVIRATEK